MKRIRKRIDRSTFGNGGRPGPFICYNDEDCVTSSQKYLGDDSIDLIIADPPYGINGETLHKHYNRNENLVIDGYRDVPAAEYDSFSLRWIQEAERVLRTGGSMYILSGWTNLYHILRALRETNLVAINHIIWKYNFGVYTRQKYVTSHYHILYVFKPGGPRTFNVNARFSFSEKTPQNRSALYGDLEDVWIINREYKIGKTRHKNELPQQLLIKMVQYSSNENEIIADFFGGSFSTAKVAKGLNRSCITFEINKTACDHQVPIVSDVRWGGLLSRDLFGNEDSPKNQYKPWTDDDLDRLSEEYNKLRLQGLRKRAAIARLEMDCGRGYFAILNALKRRDL